MVKVNCDNCQNCSSCCQNMGNFIILDPLDHHRISQHLELSFEALLKDIIELNIVDGIILPNLKMSSQNNHSCVFLNTNTYILFVQGYVVFFLWEEYMKIIAFPIFYRFTNALNQINLR